MGFFQHPLSDGGTFTGVADIVGKYGLVPKEAMPETNSSDNTSRMANLISLKLKEYGLQLRDLASNGAKPAALDKEKTAMLGTIYRMLVLNLGVPPTEFDYVRKDAQGNPARNGTPHSDVIPQEVWRRESVDQLCDGYERSLARVLQVL